MSLLGLMRRRASRPVVVPTPNIAPFSPLFAVAGGQGRNAQPAFQYLPLPANVAIDGTVNQSAFQAELNAKAQADRWINYSGFTTKRIIVPNNQALEPVLLWRSNWGDGFTGTNYPSWAAGADLVCRGGFPVPAGYVPDSGSDKELALLQPTYQIPAWASLTPALTGRYFEGWIFEPNPAYNAGQAKVWPNFAWRCGWPARVVGMNIWPGHFVDWKTDASQGFWPFEGYDSAHPSNPDSTWQDAGEGASASGIALADSELLVEDLNRNINGGVWGLGHCIGLSVPTVGGFRWPAQRSDATSSSSYPIKYGMRVCLPSNYVIPGGLHPVCRALVQNCIASDDVNKPGYGMVIHEQTNASVVIKAQPGAQAYWPGFTPSEVLSGFPWDQLQVTGIGSDSSPIPASTATVTVTNTSVPVIGGPLMSNQTVGMLQGTWAGTFPITYAYKWQNSPDGSSWTDIPGATGLTYVAQAGDVGKVLRGSVTATNAGGSATATSVASGTVAAGSSPFLRDTLTGTEGTSVLSHTGEVGATWTRHPNATGSSEDTIRSNRLMGPTAGGTNIYYASATPPSANYDVTVLLIELTDNNSSQLSAAGRMSTTANTMYAAQYTTATGACNLLRLNSGTATVLATLTLTAKISLMLRMVGDQISVYVDNALVLGPITDTSITTAGRAGFRHGGLSSTSIGVHLDNIEAV